MLSAKLGRYYNYIELMPRMTKLKKKTKTLTLIENI